MGGYGSGRISGFSRSKCEDSLNLDIRLIKKRGCLVPGNWFSWRWSIDGESVGSIHVRIDYDLDSAVLSYNHRKQPVEQRISMDRTTCHFGGYRLWWQCPGCGRRCAVLYAGGKLFYCRKCYGLAYKCTCEAIPDRLLRKASKLRDRIGVGPGSSTPLPLVPPKGMHWTTFQRIVRQIEQVETQMWREADLMWGPM